MRGTYLLFIADGVRLQASFGEETALIYPRQIVKKRHRTVIISRSLGSIPSQRCG
jgi:hypothetical protein